MHRGISGLKEKVHHAKPKQEPVVKHNPRNCSPGQGLLSKYVDEVGFNQSSEIVQKSYNSCDCLIELPILIYAVDLLAVHVEDSCHHARTDVSRVVSQLL